MKNKIITSSLIASLSLILAGCSTATSPQINVNPAAAFTKQFNPGTFNPALVFEALSQLPQTGTLNVVGPGISFSAQRNMPPGYVSQPIIPLTPDRVTLVENDFFASMVYGMRNDHSSQDIAITPALGWNISFHLAYPPSTINTNTP